MDEQHFISSQGTPPILLRRMERVEHYAERNSLAEGHWGPPKLWVVELDAIQRLLRVMREAPEEIRLLDKVIAATEKEGKHFGGSAWVEARCIVSQWRTWYEAHK